MVCIPEYEARNTWDIRVYPGSDPSGHILATELDTDTMKALESGASVLYVPDHAALARFPTEGYSNWQWWELMSSAGAFVLDRQPRELTPIVSAIDTWFRSHRLGLLVEARVGDGKLMASSVDIVNDLDRRIVARQLRASIEEYMGSSAFNPSVLIDATGARGLTSYRGLPPRIP